MFGCRLAIRQLSRLRTVAAVPLQISNAQTTSLIYPTPCTQCRNKHSIKRPMKPAPEPINELYENPDLHIIPEREEYKELWFHVKGYDFVDVEQYTRFLHLFFNKLSLNIERIALPPRCWDIYTYKKQSENKENQYKLKTSHRILKAKDLSGTTLSLIMEMVPRHLPAGVQLFCSEPIDELEEFRYIPDHDIIALESEIAEIEKKREDAF